MPDDNKTTHPIQTPEQEKRTGDEPKTHPIQTPEQEKHTGDGPPRRLPDED